MKRVLVYAVCAFGIFSILGGCSEEEQSGKQVVNSGIVDEQYVGDSNIKIVENFKQTTEEAKAQSDILKAIEEDGGSFEGGGLSGH